MNSTTIEQETKVCSFCRKTLPKNSDYFHKHKYSRDGFKSQCKTCRKTTEPYNSEKYKKYYYENKTKINQSKRDYWKEYRHKNIEHKKVYGKKYREKNKEKLNKWKREYYKNNGHLRKEYYENNKEKVLLNGHIRRARLKKLEAGFSLEQWVKCKEYFNQECCYCGRRDELEREHFIPVTKSGEFTKNNILPACKSCNSSKNDRDFFEWYPNYRHYSSSREKVILEYLNYTKYKEQQLALF